MLALPAPSIEMGTQIGRRLIISAARRSRTSGSSSPRRRVCLPGIGGGSCDVCRARISSENRNSIGSLRSPAVTLPIAGGPDGVRVLSGSGIG